MTDRDPYDQFLKKKGVINFSVEHVVAEYLDCRETLNSLEERGNNDPAKKKIIEQSKGKLTVIEEALMPSKWWKFRKVFLAWRLIHRVGEDLIMLMNCAELVAQGRKILHDLKKSPLPDIVRLDWISNIEGRQKRLEEALKQDSPTVELGTAQLYRTITNIINDNVDDRFWDLWARRLLIFIYTSLLVMGISCLLFQFSTTTGFSLSLAGVVLLGSMGGVASGIMTTEQEYMAKGHFWISVVTYPLMRATQGALAAIIVFWMIQCHYLIRISPPLERYNKAFLCITAPVWHDPAYIRNNIRRSKSSTAFHSYSSAKSDPLLDLKAPPGKQIYLYFLVIFFSGFIGDKLLKFMSDKVTSRLFAAAEKTKDGK